MEAKEKAMRREIMRKIIFVSLGCILTGFITGCVTSREVEHLQGRGTQQSFPAPFDQTWKASVDAIYGNRLTLLITNLTAEGGFISAERGLNRSPSFGENVGIWVRPASSNKTDVEVVCRQKAPPLGLKNWEPPLLHSIAANLGQLPVVRVVTPNRDVQAAAAVPALNAQAPGASAPAASFTPTSRTEADAPLDLRQHRDELRKYETLRTAELKLEKDVRTRARLQAEVDYLQEELRSVEARLSKEKQ